MKIYKDALFTQARYGRSQLQIPTISIGQPEPEIVEVPDEWIMCLGSEDILSKPRVDSCLFVSPEGFRANMQKFKETYIKGMPGRGENRDDWEYYKSNVLSWYDQIKETNQKKIRSLEKKIAQIKNRLNDL